ncbi:hypothetical protein MTR_6g051445 [Medicago truncatula]|uniref:Uncharacterized protein n=1 Tax=Medicago truncatula TaxID=3880 RepID=A0A072U918_MEDTR|nr:hypothetical protein MTR_6g051445 [Medicago truncatula]
MLKVCSTFEHNTSCLVFNFFIYLTDAELITIAERTSNLKRLVFSFKGKLSMGAVEIAIKSLEGLQSITITAMIKPSRIFPAISKT